MRPHVLPLGLTLGVVLACAPKADTADARADGAAAAPNTPPAAAGDTSGAQLRSSDVRALRWIAGTWRGTGDVETPFYERYTFVNDSTLEVLGFADSTLAVANDTTVFSLRGGRFGNHDRPSRYVASRATAERIEFAPVNARNGFVWQKTSGDAWEATIIPLPRDGQPARERRYAMARYQPPR